MEENMYVEPHADLGFTVVQPGQYVVYAALWSRSAVLKFGKVTRLAHRDDRRWNNGKVEKYKKATVRMVTVDRNYDGKWELQKKGQEIALGFLDRLIVVDASSVPAEVKKLLDGEE